MWHIVLQISGYMSKIERVEVDTKPDLYTIEYWERHYTDYYKGSDAVCTNVFHTEE